MNKEKYPNITFTEGTVGGSPRIYGTRLAVGDVVSQLKWADSIEEVESDYELDRDRIIQALNYCANQQCLKDDPIVFCHNCILRAAQEEPIDVADYEEILINEEKYVKGDGSIFLGSMSEFLSERNGTERWNEALQLIAKYAIQL